MNRNEIKKILEQQLQLLSEQSKKALNAEDICLLTSAMSEIANLLLLHSDEQ